MKKLFICVVEILLILIIFVLCLFISLWLTNALFMNSSYFHNLLTTKIPSNSDNSLSFWIIVSIFSGAGFIYIIWWVIFLPLFWVATKLFDKYVSVKVHTLFKKA